MHLAFDDHRIDLVAAVVDGNVALQLHDARLAVDFDDRDVRAERIDEVRRIVEGGRLEPWLHALRHVPRDIRHQRDVLDRLRLVREAADEELAVLVLDVLHRGLEEMARQQLRLLLDLPRGDRERRAAHRRRAAAVGAPSHRRGLGVAVNDLHVADADAEFIRDDLREGRLLALAVRRRSDEDVRFAAWMEADDRAFPEAALETDGACDL